MRHIATEMFADEFFGSLPMEYRILWIGIIASCADDQGRFMDNAALIRSIVFPYDEKITIKVIDAGLSIFAKGHKIERYVAGTNGSGKRLIQIVNWWKYQHSTQWARESVHPAPPKWNDRIRIHRPGNGNVPYTLNWDGVGGYIHPTKKVRTSSVPTLQGDRPRPRIKPRHTPKIKQPPPKPSSSKRKPAALVVGGGNKSSSSSTWMQELNNQERELAQVMHPILRSCGLGQAKIEKLIPSVATRIKLPDAKRITLAAIASVYADDDVRNKAIVAAHRIENDQVPPLFMNSSTWQVIPAEVLQAADVNIDRSPRAMREDVIRKVASNVANR